MRRVLFSLGEVFSEGKRWLLNNLELQESAKRDEIGATRQFHFANYPAPLEDREICDKFWELCETARRQMCVSLTTYFKGDFNRSCIQLKLFTRSGVADNFTLRNVVNIIIGDVDKLLKSHVEII